MTWRHARSFLKAMTGQIFTVRHPSVNLSGEKPKPARAVHRERLDKSRMRDTQELN